MRLTQQQRTVRNVEVFRTNFINLHMAAVPIMVCRTREPARCQDVLREFAFAEENMAFRAWNIVHGWMTYDKKNPERVPTTDGTIEPFAALRMISQGGSPGGSGSAVTPWGDGIYTMMYPHMINLNKNPSLIQCIKEYALTFAECHKRLVMIVPPTYELPVELEDDVAMIEFDVPSYAELTEQIDQVLGGIPQEKAPSFDGDARDRIVSIGIGMTVTEFDNALSRALVECRNDLPDVNVDDVLAVVAACKVETIKKTDILELMPAEEASHLGGLENLKDWLHVRVASFTEEAEAFGISPPRGITLVGPPGVGKSLAAKVTAAVLGLPLIRFDVSRVFQSLVGSSEARVRSTLKLVDAMAPCVLLIDEIDKAFGGTVSGMQGDSGVGQRVLGSILTWLQESTAPVFCVTTANRSEYLPPELMRRGRMDEVFSVQMPSEDERREIFAIHLDKRGHDHEGIEGLELAIDASSGFVGAEIEAAVKDALIESFSENDGVLTGQVIANQFSHMKPLSVAFAEQFAAMAEWAHNNARPANAGEPPAPVRARTRGEPAMDPSGRGTSHRRLNLDG